MTARRRRVCEVRPCGSYAVDVDGDKLRVTCGVCGEAGRYSARAARALAARLAGVLGRFETTAPRKVRLELAALLRRGADRLDADRRARRRA